MSILKPLITIKIITMVSGKATEMASCLVASMPLTAPTSDAVARLTKHTRDRVIPQKILIFVGGSTVAAFFALMDSYEMVVVMESARVTMEMKMVNKNTQFITVVRGRFSKKANTADSVPFSPITFQMIPFCCS